MRTLFISDCHIGSPHFSNGNKTLLKFVLENTIYDRLILNGDIIDKRFNFKIEEFFKEYKDIIIEINNISIKKDVYYLIGECDPELKYLNLIFDKTIKITNQLETNQFICMHGHQFNYSIKKFSKYAKFIYWCNKESNYFNFSITDKQDKKYFKNFLNEIEIEAKRFSNNKVIVIGHTHKPKKSSKIYINIGDWLKNRTFITHDDQTNKFLARKVL